MRSYNRVVSAEGGTPNSFGEDSAQLFILPQGRGLTPVLVVDLHQRTMRRFVPRCEGEKPSGAGDGSVDIA